VLVILATQEAEIRTPFEVSSSKYFMRPYLEKPITKRAGGVAPPLHSSPSTKKQNKTKQIRVGGM
jgi:hypothetical protein